jgi:hypothetical protein
MRAKLIFAAALLLLPLAIAGYAIADSQQHVWHPRSIPFPGRLLERLTRTR